MTLDALIPERFDNASDDERRHARLVLYAIFVANIATVLVSIMLCQLDHDLTATRFAITIPLQTLTYAVLYYSGSPRIASHFFMVVIMVEIMIDYGPDDGFGVLAAIMIPIAAAALLGARACAVWTVIAALWAGLVGPLWLRADDFTLAFGMGAAICTLIVGLAGFFVEYTRADAMAGRSVAQAKLAQREKSLLAFASSTFPAHATVRGGVIDTVSPDVEELLGYDQDELIGQQVQQFLHSDDRREASEQWRLRADQPIRVEARVRHKDGKWVWVESFSLPLEEEGAASGAPVRLFTIRSIAEERRTREQRQRANRLEGVGMMAAGVAHDFNNLLTIIGGFAELLPAGEERDNIVRATTKAGAITADLLRLSRSGPVEQTAGDLAEAIGRWGPMIEQLSGDTVEVDINLQQGCTVAMDEARFNQVLLNLVANAREAMPDGGRIEVSLTQHDIDQHAAQRLGVSTGRYAQLRVVDTGQGMSEAVVEKAFDPFFTTKGDASGSGLGLSTVFGIVRQHNGAIELDSVEGEGTRFDVYLPITEITGDTARAPSVASVTLSGAAIARVLLVEDDELVRTWLQRALETAGYDVLVADSGEAALALDTNESDLVVSDVVMTGIDGPELVRRLRQARTDLPVVFISGYTDSRLIEQEALDERTRFLAKPFTSAQLYRVLEELLGSAQAEGGASGASEEASA